MSGSFIVIAGTDDNLVAAIAAAWQVLETIVPLTRLQAIRDPWRHIIRHMLAHCRTIRLGDHIIRIHNGEFFADQVYECPYHYYRYEAGALMYSRTTYAAEITNPAELEPQQNRRWSFLFTDNPTPIMVLAYLCMPIPL